MDMLRISSVDRKITQTKKTWNFTANNALYKMPSRSFLQKSFYAKYANVSKAACCVIFFFAKTFHRPSFFFSWNMFLIYVNKLIPIFNAYASTYFYPCFKALKFNYKTIFTMRFLLFLLDFFSTPFIITVIFYSWYLSTKWTYFEYERSIYEVQFYTILQLYNGFIVTFWLMPGQDFLASTKYLFSPHFDNLNGKPTEYNSDHHLKLYQVAQLTYNKMPLGIIRKVRSVVIRKSES